jgi:hypothetical protein
MSGNPCAALGKADEVCYYRFTGSVNSAPFDIDTGAVVHVHLDTDIALEADSGAEISIHVVASGDTAVGSRVPADAIMDDTLNAKTYVLYSGRYYIEVSSPPTGETALVKLEVVSSAQ